MSQSHATIWTCEVSQLPGGSALESLTVGAKFGLKCSGAEVQDFNTRNFSLEMAKPDKFRLRILENRKSTSSSIELTVTSYVPGDTSLRDVVISDGQNRIALDSVKFSVKSVIKQEDVDPKPFPPEPPVDLQWPMSVIVIVIAVFVVFVTMVLSLIRRSQRRAKFVMWLNAIRTPLSPFDQLSKDLRKCLKERDPKAHITELEIATQTYLSRLYRAPLMTRSPSKILKVITRGDKKVREKLSPLTIRLFGEFERVSESLEKSQLNASDALNVVLPQIHELIREFAEIVQVEHRKERGGAR
jgi:hypothetical protein